MFREKIGPGEIISAGYDPLCAVLEVQLSINGEVLRYKDVPEDTWYAWKNSGMSRAYFYGNIWGRFRKI